ncbi:MAG: ABC transporter permease, partial [Epsilonproteobacteria bacterium]|nr:ABC transporter permease [Campylobacterota bacterium]
FLFAYVVAIFLGYIYVFIFNAPILRDIFIGNYNLNNLVAFVPVVDFSILSAIFFIFVIPFFAAILIPVWKIATITPKEAML